MGLECRPTEPSCLRAVDCSSSAVLSKGSKQTDLDRPIVGGGGTTPVDCVLPATTHCRWGFFASGVVGAKGIERERMTCVTHDTRRPHKEVVAKSFVGSKSCVRCSFSGSFIFQAGSFQGLGLGRACGGDDLLVWCRGADHHTRPLSINLFYVAPGCCSTAPAAHE